jgi:hypothetical protein
MTTPWQPTPGDQREDHAQAAADTIAAIYAQAELVIIAAIATLARKVATGTLLPAIAVRRLRQTVNTVLSSAAPRVRTVLEDAMQGASEAARDTILSTAPEAITTLPEAANPARRVPDLNPWTQPLAELLDTAGDTAAQSAEDAFTAVTAAAQEVPETAAAPAAIAAQAPVRLALPAAPARLALPPAPPPENPYEAALGRAFGKFGGWPGSTLSARRIEAAQAMLDDLAEHGITGFTDKTGRKWDLASYVEMATRTAVSNAWDDMQAGAAIRSGLDLVETGTHSTEGSCPLCIPWLGRTLSLTGATEGYATVDEAKAAGWRHPNCRCFWVVIGGGYMADVTNPVDIADAAEVYKASQQQRALERRVRAAGRRAQAAVTPQAKTRARRELAAARAASAAHRQQHQLRIMKVTSQRRERPFGPR